MTDPALRREDYFTRRMRQAMADAADVAADLSEDPGIALPPEYVGRMGLEIYRSRMRVAFADVDVHDLPADDGVGTY